MKLRTTSTLLFACLLVLGLTACDSGGADDGEDDDPPLETLTVNDLPADPAATGGGPGAGTGRYTFFSLRDDEIVLRYDNETRADSASTAWDLAFQATTIRTNNGTSGPGGGAAYVAQQAFQEIDEVDMDRFSIDSEEQLAIPTGSDNGWYNYSPMTNTITPLSGRTLVVRTADGEHYAKIRILSYYEGAPTDPADSGASSRYYTFDYMLSDDPSFE